MNLQIIKDYFTCVGNVEELRIQKISAFRSQFPMINVFSLFKQLSSSSAANINSVHMKKYLSQFSHNLQIIDSNDINNLALSKDFGTNKKLSNDEVIEKGISMFLNQWGNQQKQFTFSEFSRFFIGEQCSPQEPQQVPYHARKKLFEIIQSEIQGLLNINTLNKVCIKEYKNLLDLFQTIASKQTHHITTKSIKNLYLMHGQRMSDSFYERIQTRLNLPISYQLFLIMFKKDLVQKNTKVQQRKVYYSSARRRKDTQQKHQYEECDYFDEQSSSHHINTNNQYDNKSCFSNSRRSVNFLTPSRSQYSNKIQRGITSTKLTKGEKITTQLKQLPVTVGRFKSQTPQRQYTNNKATPLRQQIQVLGEILNYQQQFIKLKRNLCLRRDMDLELAYQRVGEKFSQLLNQLYGCCNFTSFVRFIVPKDFEYRYLAFVRHETSNILSQQTLMLFDQLLQAYYRKQHVIRELWTRVDREMIFRMYCNPGQQGISVQQFERYFSDRQCRVLIQRMDPLGVGVVEYQRFW